MNRLWVYFGLWLALAGSAAGAAEVNTVTLDVKGVAIREVVSDLAKQSGRAVIVMPQVPKECLVTTAFEKLSLEPALDAVCKDADIFWERQAELYRICAGKRPNSFHFCVADGFRLWMREMKCSDETRKVSFAEGGRVVDETPASAMFKFELSPEDARRFLLIRGLRSVTVRDEQGKDMGAGDKAPKRAPFYAPMQKGASLTVHTPIPTGYKGKASVTVVFDAFTKLGTIALHFKELKKGATAHQEWVLGSLNACEIVPDRRKPAERRLKFECKIEGLPKEDPRRIAPPEWVIIGKDGTKHVFRASMVQGTVRESLALPKGLEPVELIYRKYVPMPPLRALKFEIKDVELP